MNNLAERLQQALKRPPGYSQKDLANACEVKPPSVSDWLSGRTKKMEGANLLMAAEFLNVNPWWLATGRGSMERSPKDFPAPVEAAVERKWPLTIDEDQFHALPGEAKQRINDFIEDTVSRYRAQLHMKSKKAGQR